MAVSASSQPPPSRARPLDQSPRAPASCTRASSSAVAGRGTAVVTASPKPGRLDARQHGPEPIGALGVPTPEVVVEVALVGEEEDGHGLVTLGRPGTVAPMTGHRLLPGTDPRLRVAPWRGDTHVAHLTPGRGRPTARRRAPGHRRPRRRRLHERAHRGARPARTSSRSSRPGSRSTSGSTSSSAPSTTCPRSARPTCAAGTTPTAPRCWSVDAAAFPAVLAARRPGPRRRAGGHTQRAVPCRHRPTAATGGSSATPSPGRAGPRGYLQRLAVHPDHQRAGLGGALVVDGLRWLRRWGAKEVLVNTQEGNEPGRPPLRSPRVRAPPRRAWPSSASPSATRP